MYYVAHQSKDDTSCEDKDEIALFSTYKCSKGISEGESYVHDLNLFQLSNPFY